MKRSEAFTGSYLKQDDVPSPMTVAVGRVQMETLGQGADAETKPVLHFTNQHIKPMVLNFGNWNVLETAYGEDSDMWLNKPVEVYVDPNVMFGTKRVGGLRLRVSQNGHANGHAQQSQMNLAMAEAALAPVNLTKADLIRCIQAKYPDAKRFEPARDTPIVYAMIKEAEENLKNGSNFDEFGGPAEDF